MSIQKVFATLILAAVLFSSFQNCSRTSHVVFTENLASKMNDSEGGAQPYDGKIYILTGAICADGSDVHAKIILSSSTSGQLVRENCQDINPVNLSSSDFALDPTDSSKLYYQSQIFVPAPTFTLTSIQASSDTTHAYYSYDYSGPVIRHQIYLDVDMNISTGYTGRAGLGADYMIENGNLYRYSGVNGAWGWTVMRNNLSIVTSNSVAISVLQADIGSPTALRFLIMIGNDSGGTSSGLMSQTF